MLKIMKEKKRVTGSSMAPYLVPVGTSGYFTGTKDGHL